MCHICQLLRVVQSLQVLGGRCGARTSVCTPSFLLLFVPCSPIPSPSQLHGDQSRSLDHTKPLLEKPHKHSSSLLTGAGSGARPVILEGKPSKCWIKPLEQMLPVDCQYSESWACSRRGLGFGWLSKLVNKDLQTPR